MCNKVKYLFRVVLLLLVTTVLSGCSDMVQIEDRDFIMGFAVSYDDNQYNAIFQKPDLGSITGQGVKDEKELLVRYSGANISKIKEAYAEKSEKRLDFSHLKVIILDEKISTNQMGMEDFLRYIENDYEISRNTLVFYTSGDGKNINGKIGEELEQLYQNNPSNVDIQKVTIGDMIDCLYQKEKLLSLPILEISEDGISLSGAALFQQNQIVATITEEELTEWNMLQGKGSKRSIAIPSGEVIKLKQIKVKSTYRLNDGMPYIQFYIDGEAELIEGITDANKNVENSFNQYLKIDMEQQINTMLKDRGIDYGNFYRNMSYKNRSMWSVYEGKQDQFLSEVSVLVDVRIKVEMP